MMSKHTPNEMLLTMSESFFLQEWTQLNDVKTHPQRNAVDNV
jgi:hypothetical protein